MLSGSENFEGVDFKRAIARTPIIIGKRISTYACYKDIMVAQI